MAHSTSTTNYGLSQFAGTDKPAWLEDYNADMLAIDTNLKSASDSASTATTAIVSIQSELDDTSITATSAEIKSSSALTNQAETYSAASTYEVGDKVLYNNLLYKCTTAITTAESFDGAKWERTSTSDELDTLQDNINTVDDNVPTLVDISSQIIAVDSASIKSAKQYGKLVILNIRYDRIDSGILFSGLPKPIDELIIDYSFIDTAGNISSALYTLDTNGNIYYEHRYGTNTAKRIQLSYFTNE